MKIIALILTIFLFCENNTFQAGIYRSIEGKVQFRSDASLETIEANSDALKGVIDIEKRSFSF